MPTFAANLGLMFPDVPLASRAELLSTVGFRHAEYQFPYAEPADSLRRILSENHLRMVLINAPCGNRSAGDRGIGAIAGREGEFQDAIGTALDYARAVGCDAVHVMSGIVADDEGEMAISVYVDNLKWAAPLAAAAGIDLLVEPINGVDVPGYLIQRAAQARAVLAMVDEPNVFLQFDAYHALVNGEDPLEGLRANFDVIRHIQIAGYPGRHEPGTTGDYDPGPFFELCDTLGYTGTIGCEYLPEGPTADGLRWAYPYGIG